MDVEKSLKISLKISAIFLWYFTPLFLFIVSDIGSNLFQQDTILGNLIVRYPYQWDYELMFAGFYFIWGVFIWKASKNPENNLSFIKFTAWGFFANVLTNIIAGLFRMEELAHLMTDSIPWFVLGYLILYFSKKLKDKNKRPLR